MGMFPKGMPRLEEDSSSASPRSDNSSRGYPARNQSGRFMKSANSAHHGQHGRRRPFVPGPLVRTTTPPKVGHAARKFTQQGGQARGLQRIHNRSQNNMYRSGQPVNAMNMKFQGNRDAFKGINGGGKLGGSYNGKKFSRAANVVTEADRKRILAGCTPRTAEEENWDNEASLKFVKDFYGSDPMESELAKDPVVTKVLSQIDSYTGRAIWADEDELAGDAYNFE